MSGPSPFDPFGASPDGPFGEQFAELLRRFSGVAPGATWDQARQMAAAIAAEGDSEPNIDPIARMHYEELARVAELHLGAVMEVHPSIQHGIRVIAVNRGQWSAQTVDDYKPIFEHLATSLTAMMRAQLDDLDRDDIDELSSMLPAGLDMSALVNSMSQMMGPAMLTSLASSTVGQLGRRALGSFDLPIPRPAGTDVMVVASAVDAFGAEWSLPADDLRLWICLHEMAHQAVLSTPHVRSRLTELLTQHASTFRADPERLAEQLGDITPDDPMGLARLQDMLANPDVMFSTIRSDDQRAVLPMIDSLVGCIEGYVDWVVDTIGSRLLGSSAMVGEAMRRRRVEADQATRFIERLFGLELTQAKIDAGSGFVDGVVQRAGAEALTSLWSRVEHLPTPAELAAPGLWLARVGIATDLTDLPGSDDLPEIPDFPDLDQ